MEIVIYFSAEILQVPALPLMVMLHNTRRTQSIWKHQLLKAKLFLVPNILDKKRQICPPFIWPAFIYSPSAALSDSLPIRPSTSMQHSGTRLSILSYRLMSLHHHSNPWLEMSILTSNHPRLCQAQAHTNAAHHTLTEMSSVTFHKTHPLSPSDTNYISSSPSWISKDHF